MDMTAITQYFILTYILAKLFVNLVLLIFVAILKVFSNYFQAFNKIDKKKASIVI